MVTRRRFVSGSVAALGMPCAAHAQQSRKIRHIGVLTGGSAAGRVPGLKILTATLGELGWIVGRTIVVSARYADAQYARLPALASELVGLNVDVIVAGNVAVAAAKRVTATIPIVMVGQVDPVGQGFIATLSRPGGNITGLAWDADPDISAKYLELLKAIVPGLSRVGAIIDPGLRGIGVYREAAMNAAPKLGLTVHHAEVRDQSDIPNAFSVITGTASQAVFVYGSPVLTTSLHEIVSLAAKQRLPAIYVLREAVAIGGLISYGVSVPDIWRRAATYVDKILKGTPPGDLPVEQPTTYELVINMKTAKELGLTIPPSVLLRAEQVIQ
jgi:putative tryptophan/tyrosine transport system substrate-binding protein